MTRETEWTTMMTAARQGDPAAWGRLLESHRDRLLLLAQQRLRGPVAVRVEAADVVQQTFLDAHRGLAQFLGDSEAAFAAWIETILDHTIDHALRDNLFAQKRDVRREQSLDDTAGDGPSPGTQIDAGYSTPSKKAMRAEEEQRLTALLDALPPDQREAVTLRHFQRCSLADIARHMGKSKVAVAALVKRGMQALRKHLDGPDEAP